MSRQNSENTVRKRQVFYLPGYDPNPPRRYRELYRKEGKAQAETSGYSIEISPKTDSQTFGWYVVGQQDGFTVHTEIDVLVWSDIVRYSMVHSIPATYVQLAKTAWIYISTGVLSRLMRLRKGPVIAALYPVGMLLGQLVLALILGGIIASLFWPLGGQLALIPAAGSTYALLHWFRKIDNRLFAYYLMHDYAHSAKLRGRTTPEMQRRLDQFADQIAQALASDVDEVLVVGHSSGAHLGVMVLAELDRRRNGASWNTTLSFLTLGQVVPMVSFLPEAYQLRADLERLSTSDCITWVDVSAPGDGCAFALCDPVAVTGVAGPDKRWPLVLSAAFTQTLSPERWKALRWRFFRLHFQYLCAFDRVGDYDYFKITAGPQTLGERFKGRAPSKSRKETALSPFTSVRA